VSVQRACGQRRVRRVIVNNDIRQLPGG
jgi:hypothetical protein